MKKRLTKEQKESAFEFGKKAFARGVKCIPCLDKEFLDAHIVGLKVGEGGDKLMKYWIKGWTQANLTAVY